MQLVQHSNAVIAVKLAITSLLQLGLGVAQQQQLLTMHHAGYFGNPTNQNRNKNTLILQTLSEVLNEALLQQGFNLAINWPSRLKTILAHLNMEVGPALPNPCLEPNADISASANNLN
eukprot:3552507-Amphidinium_carterae.1